MVPGGDELQANFCAILEAASFQDITGQRLTRVEALLQGASPAREGLENGPALPGGGLQQQAADAIFSRTDG